MGATEPMSESYLERFRAEAGDVLASILAHSRDCIKLLNLRGEFEFLSDSATDALGIERIGHAIGREWRDFWPEEQRGPIDAALAAARNGESTRFEAAADDPARGVRHWLITVSPVRGAADVITHILAVSTEVTAQKAEAERDRQRLERAEKQAGHAGEVAREMRHRFKNQLAVIGAIAKLLARHTDDAGELAGKLEEKLLALAQAQDLLIDSDDRPISAPDAILRVLGASGAGDRVRLLDCPGALLGAESIQQLALLLGDLQTNALKHGALAQAGGRIELTCEQAGDDTLTLRWREYCPEPVTPPPASGNSGFQLIRRIGAAGARQPSISWDGHGIIVEFHLRTVGEIAA